MCSAYGLCMARVWAGGSGRQCPLPPVHHAFCKKHSETPSPYGRVDCPISQVDAKELLELPPVAAGSASGEYCFEKQSGFCASPWNSFSLQSCCACVFHPVLTYQRSSLCVGFFSVLFCCLTGQRPYHRPFLKSSQKEHGKIVWAPCGKNNKRELVL